MSTLGSRADVAQWGYLRCKEQIKMVASPRNDLYRTPIGTNFPAFRSTGKLDHVGDLPTSSIVKPPSAALTVALEAKEQRQTQRSSVTRSMSSSTCRSGS